MDKNLNAFLNIAETGNLTQAAKAMNLTQPTLTKRLKQLENQYGSVLLERHPRGVQLTTSGLRLLVYAKRIRSNYIQSQEAVRSLLTGHLSLLRVGAGPLFQFRFLAPALTIIRREFPDTQLILEGGVNSDNLPKLRDNELDVVFGSHEYTEFDELFEYVALTHVETGILLHADHPLATSTPVEPQQLMDLSWVTYSSNPDYRQQVVGFFKRKGLNPPKFDVDTNSFTLGMQLVAEGGFVMTAPIALGLFINQSKLTMIRTSPPLAEFSTGVYVRTATVGLPIVQRLIEEVRNTAQSLQPY